MRSGAAILIILPKRIKLANFVQFKRMLMFCLEDWGTGPPYPPCLRTTARSQGCNLSPTLTP